LSNKDGSHAFAATLAQHEANIEVSRAAGLLP
jgi:cell division protein YceG involved in septum cleavage